MLISKNKRGFTLVEVLVSLGIFAMVLLSAVSLMATSNKLEKRYNRLQKEITYLEGLKGVMEGNFSHSEISNLKNENKIYITKENMDYEYLKDERIKSAFTSSEPDKMPYISIQVEGDRVLKVVINLNTWGDKEKQIYQGVFYKGLYNWSSL